MYSWKDRLVEWIDQRGAWTRILVAVGIMVVITIIILLAAIPSKSAVNDNTAGISEVQTTLGTKASQSELNSWSQNISKKLGTLATAASLANAINQIKESDIKTMQGRLTTAEGKLEDAGIDIDALVTQAAIHGINITTLKAWSDNMSITISDAIAQIKVATNQTMINEQDIVVLEALTDSITGNVTAMFTTLLDIEGDLEDAMNSPPEAYLTGTFGNYILHAKSNVAGDFTANVHLVFSPPLGVGNATTYSQAVANFYASLIWMAPNIKAYVPVPTYNGIDWGISEVWWSVDTFELAANTETNFNIIFGGLAAMPSFAYVVIYPALK